jgi:hypothetical protein
MIRTADRNKRLLSLFVLFFDTPTLALLTSAEFDEEV